MWFSLRSKLRDGRFLTAENSTSSTATTSLTTQPANPPSNPPQAANSTSSTFHLESPQPLPLHRHHLQSPTATRAASTPAAPTNTSPKAAHSHPRKSNARVPIVPTKPAPSLANSTMPLPSTASPAVLETPNSSPIARATAIRIAMCLRSLPRAAVLLHRLRPRVRPRGLRQRVRALATALALPDLVPGSSLTAAVTCVGMTRVAIVPRKAKTRSNIVPARQGDRE